MKSKSACKMSASLAALVVSTKKTPATRAFLALGTKSAGATAAEPSVHVFIRSNNPAKTKIGGIQLSKGAGNVMTAIVPMSKLKSLIAAKEIDRISAPRQMRPLMDVASPLVRVPQFRQSSNTSGRGVIIGIVDTGIDVTHPSFAGRILSVWDQTIAGSGPGPGFSALGTLLTTPSLAVSKDTHGHGTHVAGIASGKGSPFQGVAPDADLIIVKTNFQNSAIAEGVRWIFAEATRLGRPCVVNLSLGGQFDGHDGLDDTSVAISDECGPGRLVVAAAGNEGTDAIHVAKSITATSPGSFDILVNPTTSSEPAPFFLLNGWYSGKGVCSVRLVSSTGAATPFQSLITTDPGATSTVLGNDTVIIATPDELAANGDRQFVIQVEGNFGSVQGGTWRLEVKRKSGKPGKLHVWLLTDPDASSSARFAAPSFNTLIGSPGSAARVVTVASFTSRNQFTDVSGQAQMVGLAPNTISEFSSPGPLRKGGRKPDVAAPGAMIASCLSSKSQVQQKFVVAPRFRVNAGTSMASPFIAGVLALRLEQHPQLTPTQAKTFLKQRSAVPGLAAGTHDLKWGFGLLKL